MPRRSFLLVLLGGASLLPYLAALGLGDLRVHTPEFVLAFAAAFALYLAAAAVAVRLPASPSAAALIVLFALLFRAALLPTRPTLSDDMYRYVWDGRVQAIGLSPYRYPPRARELSALRRNDRTIWRYINRKEAVTVYPPGAQLAFAGIWRIVGDDVTGFKAAFVAAELLGAALLLQVLRHFQLPSTYLLIYLWSPLLIFEVAHAGHVDGLMLPVLIAAFWARVRERPVLLGLALGAAAMLKLFPALLLPALLPLPGRWSRAGLRAPLLTLLAFSGVIGLAYAPYRLWGGDVIGFLPNYFGENFNLGLARVFFEVAPRLNMAPSALANAVTFGGLAMLALVFGWRPAVTGEAALRRCVWLIGWFTLFTQNLFPWYLLWLLPLLVLFVRPGRFLGFTLTPIFAWLVFSGAVTLSYLFFVEWRVNAWAQAAEYAPLYLLLAAAAARPRLAAWLRRAAHRLPGGRDERVGATS
jgi:hypothetical protein